MKIQTADLFDVVCNSSGYITRDALVLKFWLIILSLFLMADNQSVKKIKNKKT